MEELMNKKFSSDSEEDEDYVPSEKELEKLNKSNKKKTNGNNGTLSKVDLFWEKMKIKNGVIPPEKEEKKIDKEIKLDETKEKDIENEIKKAIEKLKENKEKTITKEYFFAGQKFKETKEISEKEIEKINKLKTHSKLDSIIEDIRKKKNISTIDKSKKDWKNYVEENNIEKELNQNRKDGFLGKKKFIDNINEIVNEQQKISYKKAKYAFELKQNDNKNNN